MNSILDIVLIIVGEAKGLWKFVEFVKPAPQYCGVRKVYKVDYSPPTGRRDSVVLSRSFMGLGMG
jgi:hypothetical protein